MESVYPNLVDIPLNISTARSVLSCMLINNCISWPIAIDKNEKINKPKDNTKTKDAQPTPNVVKVVKNTIIVTPIAIHPKTTSNFDIKDSIANCRKTASQFVNAGAAIGDIGRTMLLNVMTFPVWQSGVHGSDKSILQIFGNRLGNAPNDIGARHWLRRT